VLDFGLAKLVAPTSAANDETVSLRTTPGAIVGTFLYMSPEQAEGNSLDARSDVFSFDSVLYEMLTGNRAFQGGRRLLCCRPLSATIPSRLMKCGKASRQNCAASLLAVFRRTPKRAIRPPRRSCKI
jgi:eukaryotic-like serine/threonine-protein kinase